VSGSSTTTNAAGELLARVVVTAENDLLRLGVAMTDGGLLTVHAAAITENDATASLEAAAMCRADDFGLGSSASQNEQTCNSNRLHFLSFFLPFAAEVQRDMAPKSHFFMTRAT